jgi:hypothetical protein
MRWHRSLDSIEAVTAARAESRGLMGRLTMPGDDARPSPFIGPRWPIRFDGRFTAPPPAEALRASSDVVVVGRESAAWPG